ncbi:hypothetical protein ACKWTF_015358 [Chironomus riparius]
MPKDILIKPSPSQKPFQHSKKVPSLHIRINIHEVDSLVKRMSDTEAEKNHCQSLKINFFIKITRIFMVTWDMTLRYVDGACLRLGIKNFRQLVAAFEYFKVVVASMTLINCSAPQQQFILT